MIRMQTLFRQFWILSKEILSNQQGNGGTFTTPSASFESKEEAIKCVRTYAKTFNRTCGYCGGKIELINSYAVMKRKWPDKYKTPPPGAKDLKILDVKGGEEWGAKYKTKCQKCGAATEGILDSNEGARTKELDGSFGSTSISIDDSKCFIATSVYNNQYAPQVIIFQDFKANVLMRVKIGRLIVKIYNVLSPPIANFIINKKLIRAACRVILDRLALMIKYGLIIFQRKQE